MSPDIVAFAEDADSETARSALCSTGIVRWAGAFPAAIAERFYAAASEVFALSPETKEVHRRHGMTGGFTPPGIEGVRDHGPDFSRSFWDTLDPIGGENRYPECAIGQAYQSAATELFSQVEAAVSALLRSTYPDVAAVAQDGRHLLRASSYAPAPAGHVVFPSHVDFGLITAYVGGAPSGLQGLIDGVWTNVDAPAGDLFLAAGTTLRSCPFDIA